MYCLFWNVTPHDLKRSCPPVSKGRITFDIVFQFFRFLVSKFKINQFLGSFVHKNNLAKWVGAVVVTVLVVVIAALVLNHVVLLIGFVVVVVLVLTGVVLLIKCGGAVVERIVMTSEW